MGKETLSTALHMRLTFCGITFPTDIDTILKCAAIHMENVKSTFPIEREAARVAIGMAGSNGRLADNDVALHPQWTTP